MAASDLSEQELESIRLGNEKCRQWLEENIGWREQEWPEIPTVEESDAEALVEAYPIMGIEKYLGNADRGARIAFFPQVKMCHDSTKSVAYVKFSKEFKESVCIVDGKETPLDEVKGMQKFVERLREWVGIKTNFLYIFKNEAKVKAKGKGLGMSASGAAAAAKAFAEALVPEISDNARFLSVLARYSSGSGTSSAVGGWSVWLSHKGIDPLESYAVRFDRGETKLRAVVVPIPSTIKTEDAHGAAEASELYQYWATRKPEKCIRLMEAVKADNIAMIGRAAELDSINLFHLLVSGKGFFNWEPETLGLLRKVNLLRRERNLTAFATMDTGPSVAVITTKAEANEVKAGIEEYAKAQGKEEEWKVHFADVAGAPKKLPLKELERLLTNEVREILKKKDMQV